MTVSIPEVLEGNVGESIGSRTGCLPTFKELGPPDLVHLSKQVPKSGKENGTYHYVTGVDTSSSASIAAYLNTLTFSLGEQQLWFGKVQGWKVHSGEYCTFNAFSRVDVRVKVMIPGTVQTYVIDERGENQTERMTEDQWEETFMSAMLRSLLYCDDDVYYVSCCRRMNPLSKEASSLFLQVFERLFSLGPALGSVSETQVPTLTSNYLVDGFFKFVEVTGMFDQALETVERILAREPEVMVLKAKLLLMQHQEVDSVKTMSEGIRNNPRDSEMLELESKFCKEKGSLDLALDCAIRAVNSSPSEFTPWATLVQIYTARKEYEAALLTLNSCPMFTYHDVDSHRMPPPARVHLPLPNDGVMEEVWNVNTGESDQDQADPDLLKLPAPTLRATFAKAYELLTEIAKNIGWDALLKKRSNVFVMEEEYRKDKVGNGRKGSAGTAGSANATNGDATSTTAVVDKPQTSVAGEESASTAAAAAAAASSLHQHTPSLHPDEVKNGGVVGELRNKRLCERWLDNLFMVLYEDLRVYTVWRSNYIQHQSQQIPYEKTALEWEILGMVAYRLRHKEEALEAFSRSLRLKFSHRVLWKMLDDQTSNRKPDWDIVVKLIAWNHRWYSDFSPKLMMTLRSIVAKDGLTKVQNNVSARYNNQGIVGLMEQWYKTLKSFNADGTDS